jgi:hypothetical protein
MSSFYFNSLLIASASTLQPLGTPSNYSSRFADSNAENPIPKHPILVELLVVFCVETAWGGVLATKLTPGIFPSQHHSSAASPATQKLLTSIYSPHHALFTNSILIFIHCILTKILLLFSFSFTLLSFLFATFLPILRHLLPPTVT